MGSRLSVRLVRKLICAGLVSCVAVAFGAPPDDPYFSSSGTWKQPYDDQWGLKAIGFTGGADSAWSIENGRKTPVIVALLDTGLDFFHPDLNRDNIWRNTAEQPNGIDDDGNGYVDDLIGWNFVENSNNPWDFAGHGTHIAGIIGAASNNGEGIAGINWGVKIMPLKIMNFTGRGRTIPLAAAIYYAVDKGARVINLSLGAEDSSLIQREAIDYANAKGVLVVVAAGNSSVDTATVTPAGLDNVVTVASTTPDGQRAEFSNWGHAVDIAAPGVDILSLRARRTDLALVAGQPDYTPGEGNVGAENRYYRTSGSSFSAAFVSGVASLLFAKYPDATPAEVKNMLLQSARDIDSPGTDQLTGYGILDAWAALNATPGFFIDATITGIQAAQKGKKTVLQVLGTLDSDSLKQGWIEIGAGEAPSRWQKASDNIRRSVRDGVLAELDVQQFGGSKVWIIRLIVEHKNGSRREARQRLDLQ